MIRRRRAWIPLAGAVLVAMAACAPGGGGDSTGSGGDGGADSGEDVDLTVWSWRVEDAEQYEAMFDVYEEQNPGVTVEFKPFKNTEYNQILATGLTGSGGPDVVQLKSYGGLQASVDSEGVLPLDGEIAGLEQFPDEILAALTGYSDGRVYGVPFAISTLHVIYNKEIFADLDLSVPTTWSEFLDVAEALDAAGLVPIALPGADAQVSVPVATEVLGAARYGGSDFAAAVQAGGKDFTAPEYVASLELMKELEPYFPDDVTATSYDDARVQFVSRAAGMYAGGVWEVGFFRSQDPEIDVGIFDVPPGDDWASNVPLTPGFVDGGYGVAANSTHPEAAKKLVEWMATPEFGQMYADELNQISPVPGVALEDPILQQAADAFADHGAPYLMLVDFRYGDPWGTDLVGDAVQKLWLGQVDAEGAAAGIQEGISQWFEPQS